MSQRRRVVVTYDISDPKRLRAVFNVMRGYGAHVQLSVFECDLADTDMVRLEGALLVAMNVREDQVLFFDLGPSEGVSSDSVRSLGRPHVGVQRGPVVV